MTASVVTRRADQVRGTVGAAAFYSGRAARKEAICVVHGNCQAEPIRRLLQQSRHLRNRCSIVWTPPVQDLTGADIEPLHAVLRQATLVVTQQVKDDYRNAPIGTNQIIRETASAQIIRFPSIFFRGTLPHQVYVRPRGDEPAVTMPLTGDYHDLRVIAAAASETSDARALEFVASYSAPQAGLDALTRDSLAEAERRDQALDVRAGDLLSSEPDAMWTINHPKLRVLEIIAGRILALLDDMPAAARRTRQEPLGLLRTPSAVGDPWVHRGRSYPWEHVARAHLSVYREMPDLLDNAVSTHREDLALLGLL